LETALYINICNSFTTFLFYYVTSVTAAQKVSTEDDVFTFDEDSSVHYADDISDSKEYYKLYRIMNFTKDKNKK